MQLCIVLRFFCIHTVGEDYVDFGIVTLIYRGGDRQESLMEFDITILDDDVIEPTERFQIVGVPRRNIVIPIPTLTVTILDDDGGNAYCF